MTLFVKDGLNEALGSRDQKRQQRVHSAIDLSLVEEKVNKLLKENQKESFNEFDTISREFARKSKGYLHSPYLCYVAACCWDSPQQYCVFRLGTGQGKTYVSLLLAERHCRAG